MGLENENNNQERILAVATTLFARQGLEQTSLGDIAAAAGLSKGTVYYYYRSKDDLIYDIMVCSFQKLTDSLIENLHLLGSDGSPARIVQMTLEKVLVEQDLARLTFYLTMNAITGNDNLRLKIREKYLEWRKMIANEIVNLFGLHLTDSELAAQTSTVLAVIDGITLQYLIAPNDVDISVIAQQFSRMFDSGEIKIGKGGRRMSKPKLVVLGGAGDMGERVVREVAGKAGALVVVADYNLSRARRLAEELGVEACQVDVRQRQALGDVLKDAALVVNCVGPFYRFAAPVALAAIEAGVDYIDICDDDDATLALLSLDGLARRKGVGLLVGMGWTPGISNIMVRRAAQRLDRADDVDITWVGSVSDSEGLAVIKHVVHAVTRRTPMFLNGQWIEVEALGGARETEFPAPIGKVAAYYCGHPEPVTLPRFMDGLRNVTLRGYLLPHEIQNLVRAFIVLEMVDNERKIDVLSDLLQPLLPVLSNLGEKAAPPLSGIKVEVTGTLGTETKTVSLCSVDSMERLTGIPPALAALNVLGGEWELLPGVHAPESYIEPEAFIRQLAEREIEVEEV